jgi:Ca2+-binding EF-hand superfamily protein
MMLYEFARGRISTKEMRHILKKLDVNIKNNINWNNPTQKDYKKIFQFLLEENPNNINKSTLDGLAEIAIKDKSKLKNILLYERE